MSTMASQITSVTFVYSTDCSGADQINIKALGQWPFMRGIHQWLVNSSPKGPVTRKMFLFDDVIMLFCATISLLKWCTICMGDLSYGFQWIKFPSMLSMHVQSWTEPFSLKNCYSFNIEPYCFDVCKYHWCPQTLLAIFLAWVPGYKLTQEAWDIFFHILVLQQLSLSLNQYRPTGGVSKLISSALLFSQFSQYDQNTDYLLNISFIVDRYHCSLEVNWNL